MEDLKKEEKSQKDIWSENLKAKYPDRDFSNEDELYRASMEGYDGEHEYRKKVDKENGDLVTLLTANPDVAMFIGALVNGDNLWKAMSYLKDLLPMNEGDLGWDEYNAGVAERNEEARQAEEAKKAFDENVEKSADALKSFAKKNDMSEEEAVEFVKRMQDKLANKFFNGVVDEDLFQMFYNAENYDQDLNDSREAGRIEGRNEKIEAKRAKRKNDNLPNLAASASGYAPTEKSGTVSSLEAMLGRRDRNFTR